MVEQRTAALGCEALTPGRPSQAIAKLEQSLVEHARPEVEPANELALGTAREGREIAKGLAEVDEHPVEQATLVDLARLGLAAGDVAHDLGIAVELDEGVEIDARDGAQPQAGRREARVGLERGHRNPGIAPAGRPCAIAYTRAVPRARVRYHEPLEAGAPIQIDAGGLRGQRIDPRYREAEVELHDVRAEGRITDFEFGRDRLAFVDAPTCLDRPEALDTRREAYEAELCELLETHAGARELVIFDHTLRGPGAAARPPSHHIHCDYTAESATKRACELLGPERVASWLAGPFAIVNLWRPLVRPVTRDPIAFVDPATLDPEDWLRVDIVFPDRRGQVRGLRWRPTHRWVHLGAMRPSEVAIFAVYASAGIDGVAHGAVELLEPPGVGPPRLSIESRAFVRL